MARTQTSGTRTDAQHAAEREIAIVLRRLRSTASLGERLRQIARWLRDRPYVANPLGGGPHQREVFTFSLAGFDCVTYVETALAVALARSVREVPSLLRRLRYRKGRVSWRARHHYMIEWIRENIRQGFLTDLTRGSRTRLLKRRVDAVPGIPPRTLRFRCFPKKTLATLGRHLRDGDLIFFVSTKPNLDVFHVGLLFVEEAPRDAAASPRLILSHASRRRGRVLEQELEEFLKENRMSGVILVRPREPSAASTQRGAQGRNRHRARRRGAQ
jgi:hypothetical protein